MHVEEGTQLERTIYIQIEQAPDNNKVLIVNIKRHNNTPGRSPYRTPAELYLSGCIIPAAERGRRHRLLPKTWSAAKKAGGRTRRVPVCVCVRKWPIKKLLGF